MGFDRQSAVDGFGKNPCFVDHGKIAERLGFARDMLKQAAQDEPGGNEKQRQKKTAGADVLQEFPPGDDEDVAHAAAPAMAGSFASLAPATATKTSCNVGSEASKRVGVTPRAMQAASSTPGSVPWARTASQRCWPSRGASSRAMPGMPARKERSAAASRRTRRGSRRRDSSAVPSKALRPLRRMT